MPTLVGVVGKVSGLTRPLHCSFCPAHSSSRVHVRTIGDLLRYAKFIDKHVTLSNGKYGIKKVLGEVLCVSPNRVGEWHRIYLAATRLFDMTDIINDHERPLSHLVNALKARGWSPRMTLNNTTSNNRRSSNTYHRGDNTTSSISNSHPSKIFNKSGMMKSAAGTKTMSLALPIAKRGRYEGMSDSPRRVEDSWSGTSHDVRVEVIQYPSAHTWPSTTSSLASSSPHDQATSSDPSSPFRLDDVSPFDLESPIFSEASSALSVLASAFHGADATL